MADYFTHFSCLLDVGTPENAAQALVLFAALAEDEEDEVRGDGFVISIDEPGSGRLWIRDEGSGDPEQVIAFARRCVAAFGLTGRWGFQHANTPTRRRGSTLSAAARASSTSPPARSSTGPAPMAGSPRSSQETTPMPETVEILVHRLDELSAPARERARAWYREYALDPDWHE